MTPTGRTVLALDLSTARGVIAVVRGEAVLFEAVFTSERSHNAQVFAPLAGALEAVGGSADPVLIVVGSGPGSYTGVRIAIAAAQGVALSRGWPVIAWPSITTADATGDFHVVGDARRGHFYLAQVCGGVLTGAIELVDGETARARVEGTADPAAAPGVGADDWFSYDVKPPLGLPRVRLAQPDAAALARLAARLPAAEIQRLSALPLEPVYLQEAFITTAKKAGKMVPQFRKE